MNNFTDPEAHELAEGIAEHDRLVKGMLNLREKWENETFKEYGLIGVCKELEERVAEHERYHDSSLDKEVISLGERVARLERVVATIVDYHQEGEIAPLPEPPDASWRD